MTDMMQRALDWIANNKCSQAKRDKIIGYAMFPKGTQNLFDSGYLSIEMADILGIKVEDLQRLPVKEAMRQHRDSYIKDDDEF